MPETTNRKFKILGTAWLALGGIFLALALLAFVSVVLGDDPDAQAFEAGDKWWIVVLVLLGVGAILMVPGLALLRRDPVARSDSSMLLTHPCSGPAARPGVLRRRCAQPSAPVERGTPVPFPSSAQGRPCSCLARRLTVSHVFGTGSCA